MARKHSLDLRHYHDFTRNIHSTARRNAWFINCENWDEKKAKRNDSVSCKDCRYFNTECYICIGKYHKPCKSFDWW